MIEIGDLITLNNEEEYIVINQTKINDKDYIYLVTKDGISNFLICELQNDTLNIVKDEELIKVLVERFKGE